MFNELVVKEYIAYMQSLIAQQDERAEYVRQMRDYFDGNHKIELNAQQAKVLNLDKSVIMRLNVCPRIISALIERLKVQSVNVEIEDKTRAKLIDKVLASWQRHSRLDALQNIVHRAAARDREAFILIDFDPVALMPRFNVAFAFDGTSGIIPHYMNDGSQRLLFATKHWIEEPMYTNDGLRHTRFNAYYANRVEYWILGTTGWQPYTSEGAKTDTIKENGRTYTAAVAWWTSDGTKTGEPLGVPVIPFRNADDGSAYGVSELNDVVPALQEAINKAFADLVIATDISGFPLITLTGDTPPRDDSGEVVLPAIGPGGILYSAQPDAAWGQITAADLRQFLDVLDRLIIEVAKITGTPLSYFVGSGQVAAEGTLKQQEASLIAKVEDRQVSFGNAWEDSYRMAMIVDRTFNPRSQLTMYSLAQLKTLPVTTHWRDMTPRNEVDAVTIAERKNALGIPPEEWLPELGYDAEATERIANTMEAKELAKIATATQAFMAGRVPTSANGATDANAAGETAQVVQ
jgi:hypothetical protein